MSFLTNLIVDQLCETSKEGDVQQLLSEILVIDGGVFTFCNTFPGVRMFIAPPNVRMMPTWYPRTRPIVLRVFHQFLQTGPINLQGIEDFSGDFEPDQIHYTALSGIYFVQHLADRVCALLEQPRPTKPVRYHPMQFQICYIVFRSPK